MHISAFSCFFFYMINRLFAALCSWLITCFTLIRFLNIFRQLNTIRSNIILLICLVIIFSVANSYLIVTLGYDRGQSHSSFNETSSPSTNEYNSSATRCHIRDEYGDNPITLLLNTLVAGFLNLVLPSMLTSLVNIAIVCYIKHIYKVQNPDQIQRRSDNIGTNYRSTRSTLLVISITYTLCYLPYCIIYLLLIQFGDTNGTLFYWSEIAFILRYISHSVNFYAYIFTNNRFRRDIIFLFRSCGRVCSSGRARDKQKRKDQGRYIIFHHYRLPTSTPSYDSSGKIICNYQRPTCIRFQNQSQLAQQQQLRTPLSNEIFISKQKTVVALVTPSNTHERCSNKTRVWNLKCATTIDGDPLPSSNGTDCATGNSYR